MRGNTNLKDNRTTGTALPPGQPNALVDIATSADDSAIFEAVSLATPASASATYVAVGYSPITPDAYPVAGTPGYAQPGLLVYGSASARQVTVNPIRLVRSSVSASTPRAVLSAVSDAPTTIAMPACTSGNWGIVLLYGIISWVDPSNHSAGTVASFAFWNPTFYVSTATAVPYVAALPDQADGAWHVPIAYVINVGTDTSSTPNNRIISGPTGVITGSGSTTISLGHLGASSQGGFQQSTRGHAEATNGIAAMLKGGGPLSIATGSEYITPTYTPATVARRDQAYVVKDFRIPADAAATSATDFDLDDTRDWRNANFYVRFICAYYHSPADSFAEDDPLNTGAVNQAFPYTSINRSGTTYPGTIIHTVGQSFTAVAVAATGPTAARLWAGVVSPDIIQNPANAPTPAVWLSSGNYFGVYVEASTGKLRFARSASGAIIGAYWIIVEAFFPNRPR
jgi:hypothetical protein